MYVYLVVQGNYRIVIIGTSPIMRQQELLSRSGRCSQQNRQSILPAGFCTPLSRKKDVYPAVGSDQNTKQLSHYNIDTC